MDNLLPALDKLKVARNFDQGKTAFTQSGCIVCHMFGGHGGSVGPELTAVSSRLAARDIVESILEPSKVLPEQYQNTLLTLKDGDVLLGRVVEENDQRIALVTDLVQQTTVQVGKADIQNRRKSKISPMPEGLANSLTLDQILDLVAYLQSGGRTNYAAFRQ